LRQIPPGRVTTYGILADFLDIRSPRAVGQALRANPYAPVVPCHRVVRQDGSLGGYFGESTVLAFRKKKQLLEAEGVSFDDSCRVRPLNPWTSFQHPIR